MHAWLGLGVSWAGQASNALAKRWNQTQSGGIGGTQRTRLRRHVGVYAAQQSAADAHRHGLGPSIGGVECGARPAIDGRGRRVVAVAAQTRRRSTAWGLAPWRRVHALPFAPRWARNERSRAYESYKPCTATTELNTGRAARIARCEQSRDGDLRSFSRLRALTYALLGGSLKLQRQRTQAGCFIRRAATLTARRESGSTAQDRPWTCATAPRPATASHAT